MTSSCWIYEWPLFLALIAALTVASLALAVTFAHVGSKNGNGLRSSAGGSFGASISRRCILLKTHSRKG